MKGKKLKLKRPLITFDLETTGLNPKKDRIVEICIIKRFPDARKKDVIKTRNQRQTGNVANPHTSCKMTLTRP